MIVQMSLNAILKYEIYLYSFFPKEEGRTPLFLQTTP